MLAFVWVVCSGEAERDTRALNHRSVAQHSLLVEDIFCFLVPGALPDARLTALLHDAPEYVIGDMISPFKAAVGGGYKAVEQRLQRAIHLRFGLPAETNEKIKREVKRADQIAAYFEATMLAGFSTAEATQFFGRLRGMSAERFDLACKPARTVQAAFLKRFTAIEKQRGATVA